MNFIFKHFELKNMKQSINILLFSLSLFLNSLMKAEGQVNNYYPVISMNLKVTGVDTLSNGMISITDSTVFDAHMLIVLFDTTDISQINVLLTNTADSVNLLQQSYAFSSVSRNGFSIDLDLGNYAGLLHYLGQLTIERTDGTLTDVFEDWR